MLIYYIDQCFTGKYTTRKIRRKPHLKSEWRIFHILSGEVIDDTIFQFFTVVCPSITSLP